MTSHGVASSTHRMLYLTLLGKSQCSRLHCVDCSVICLESTSHSAVSHNERLLSMVVLRPSLGNSTGLKNMRHLHTLIVSSLFTAPSYGLDWIVRKGWSVAHCQSWVRIWALHTNWASCWLISDWLGPNACQTAHLGMAGALLCFQSCFWAHVNEFYRSQVGVMGQGSDITLQTEGIAV